MTPLQRHFVSWQNCIKCHLCDNRTFTVFSRGTVPCDVLFIGEAPGASEDVLKKPFIGPAGKLFDELIFDSTGIDTHDQKVVKIAFSNLVLCLPDTVDGKLGKPSEDAITSCAPRLQQFIKICKPSIIVCVGNIATQWVPKTQIWPNLQYFDILHPSAILQMDISRRGLAVRRTVEKLQEIFNSLVPF